MINSHNSQADIRFIKYQNLNVDLVLESLL